MSGCQIATVRRICDDRFAVGQQRRELAMAQRPGTTIRTTEGGIAWLREVDARIVAARSMPPLPTATSAWSMWSRIQCCRASSSRWRADVLWRTKSMAADDATIASAVSAATRTMPT